MPQPYIFLRRYKDSIVKYEEDQATFERCMLRAVGAKGLADIERLLRERFTQSRPKFIMRDCYICYGPNESELTHMISDITFDEEKGALHQSTLYDGPIVRHDEQWFLEAEGGDNA